MLYGGSTAAGCRRAQWISGWASQDWVGCARGVSKEPRGSTAARLAPLRIGLQDDVVRLIPVNQDHIRSEVGSEVVALNEVVRFGVLVRCEVQFRGTSAA